MEPALFAVRSYARGTQLPMTESTARTAAFVSIEMGGEYLCLDPTTFLTSRHFSGSTAIPHMREPLEPTKCGAMTSAPDRIERVNGTQVDRVTAMTAHARSFPAPSANIPCGNGKSGHSPTLGNSASFLRTTWPGCGWFAGERTFCNPMAR